MISLILTIISLVALVAPVVIAFYRGCNNRILISLISICIGWTVIFAMPLIYWSMIDDTE